MSTTLQTERTLSLSLHPNVQFIYELALARLELEALGAEWEPTDDLRTFRLVGEADCQLLKRRTAYFQSINGDFTDYHCLQRYNRTRSVNQYLTHWIYPYKGKFHPQMIRALLNVIGARPGDTVLDPFIGSGTTALECQLLGIKCIGIDVSPLCVLISRVKTESLQVLEAIERQSKVAAPFATRDLEQGILIKEPIPHYGDERIANFFIVAEMVAHSDRARRRKDFVSSFHANVQRMLLSVKDLKEASEALGLQLVYPVIQKGDARCLNLAEESVDGVITSPPYSIALNYVENDAHALSALGYDLCRIKEEFIGVRGSGQEKFRMYEQDMRESIREIYRVLKPGKHCVIIIGNITYQNEEVDTTGMVRRLCSDAGFEEVRAIEKIIFGLYNVMQKDYIMMFWKP